MKIKKIKRKNEFRKLFSKGQFYNAKNITIYILKNNKNYNRFAVAVRKKSGKAVERNKIKRLIRENYRNFEKNLKKGNDIIISVNKKCELKEVNFYDIKKDCEKIFKQSKLWV